MFFILSFKKGMDKWIQEVINMPVSELTLGEEFKSVLARQGFTTLDQFMSLPLKEVMVAGWLTREFIEELAAFMFKCRNEGSS
jgi:hypothetical protein